MKSVLDALTNVKPRVFIGCTSEVLPIARETGDQLGEIAEVRLWTDDEIFELSRSTLESLSKALSDSDFAVLILTADDVTISRRKRTNSVGDNVIFEAGLFMASSVVTEFS